MVSAFWKADTRIISHSNGWLFENQPLKRLIHDSSAIPKAKDCQPYQRLTRVQSAFSKADQRQVSLMKGWQNWFLEIEKYNWSAIEKADICGQPYERLTGNFSKSQPFQRLTWWSAIEQRSRPFLWEKLKLRKFPKIFKVTRSRWFLYALNKF